MKKIYKGSICTISVFFFFFTIYILYLFDFNDIGFQFLISLYFFDTCVLLGIDSISICFLLLTTLVIPLCFLFNWKIQKDMDLEEHNNFFSIFLLLELLIIAVFLVLDLVAFYIIFEFILIPFYIIVILNKIKHYNRSYKPENRKIHAFFLLYFYTISGSLLMLISILILYINTGTTMIPLLWYCVFEKYEYLL